MWISIKIFQFLNFNRAFEWLEKGTVRMTLWKGRRRSKGSEAELETKLKLRSEGEKS